MAHSSFDSVDRLPSLAQNIVSAYYSQRVEPLWSL